MTIVFSAEKAPAKIVRNDYGFEAVASIRFDALLGRATVKIGDVPSDDRGYFGLLADFCRETAIVLLGPVEERTRGELADLTLEFRRKDDGAWADYHSNFTAQISVTDGKCGRRVGVRVLSGEHKTKAAAVAVALMRTPPGYQSDIAVMDCGDGSAEARRLPGFGWSIAEPQADPTR